MDTSCKLAPAKGVANSRQLRVHLLKNTFAPCIITEPFFFSNDRETEIVLNNKQKLVDAYVAGIDEIVATLFG